MEWGLELRRKKYTGKHSIYWPIASVWCLVINLWKNYFYEEHCLTTSNFHLHLTSSRVLTYWEYYLIQSIKSFFFHVIIKSFGSKNSCRQLQKSEGSLLDARRYTPSNVINILTKLSSCLKKQKMYKVFVNTINEYYIPFAEMGL